MKKIISKILCVTMLFSCLSYNNVLAGSTNRVVPISQVQAGADELIEDNKPAVLQIQPRNAIESGDSIILSVENGEFDRDLMERDPYIFRTKKTGTTYDEIASSGLSSYDALVKYVGDEDSNKLPYKFRWINEREAEVKLYPIPDSKVNQNNYDVTQGTPIYSIALPITAKNSQYGGIEVTIDDNGSSVTGGQTFVCGKVVGEIEDPNRELSKDEYKNYERYYVENVFSVNAGEKILYEEKPNAIVLIPTHEIVRNSSVKIKIDNGKFDKSMVDISQFKTQVTGSTYDDIVNSGLYTFDALKMYIGDENSRDLPYKITYVNEDTINVDLYPIDDAWVNQENAHVTKGVPVYKIYLPAVAGNINGDVIVAVDGRKADMINGGWYTIAKVTGGTDETTETTTITSRPSSGGGGGGGGGYHSSCNFSTTTTEATTETTTAVVEKQTETTTVEKTDMPAISNVKVTIGNNIVKIGDEEFEIDAAAYIQTSSNSTLVPLRFVALAITGGDVANADTSNNILWNAETKTATILANGKTIEFTANSNIMTIDGNGVAMDNGVKAEISDGRMFVPFRALGQALGVNVDWDGTTKTAIFEVK